jgi:F-type H+-transporting ATPase subunit a
MKIEVSIAPETLFHIGPIPITNSMLTMFLVMGAILIVGSAIARKAQVIPGRAQGLSEMIVEFLLGLVEGTAGKRVGRRIFPLVGALFIFILFANYSGLLPGIGTIGYKKEVTTAEGESATADVASIGAVADRNAVARADDTTEEKLVPFFRSPNADLNMTLALALITFTVVQIAGVRAHGVVGRIKHMADPWWIFPLEVVQEFARIISLSFRLFGNVFAGEILLALTYAIARAIRLAVIPFLFPVAFLFLEVLFGTIQALVFALLTLIYITLATAGGHDDEEHAHEREPVAAGPQPMPAGGGD